MEWSGEQCGFVIETFFKNGDSVIAIQRADLTHFQLGRRVSAPSRNTIFRWMDSVRATGLTLKKKPSGRSKTVRTPVNFEAVRRRFGNKSSRKTSNDRESDEKFQKTSRLLYQSIPKDIIWRLLYCRIKLHYPFVA